MRIFLRVVLVLLAVAVVIGGMVAGWYAWQNERGSRIWAETQRALRARGESLDRADFIPPPVPDDQNLAFAPLFVRLYQYRVDPATGLMTFNSEGTKHAAETMDLIPYGKGVSPSPITVGWQNWMTGHPLDLAKFQRYYRTRPDFPQAAQPRTPAEDVQLALARFDPLFDELVRDAGQRPQGRFPVNWTQQPSSEIALPEDIAVQKLVSAIQLRATAALTLGQPEAALRDIMLGFRLDRAIESEPVIITRLVNVVCLEDLLQPIWEGVAGHHWSAAQATTLQEELGRVDLLSDYHRTTQATRAMSLIPFADELERSRNLDEYHKLLRINGENDGALWWIPPLMHLVPRGWFSESKAAACRLDQLGVIDLIRPEFHHVAARGIDAAETAFHRMPMTPSTFVAVLRLPVSNSVAAKTTQAQAFVDEAITACALERFFLEHRAYPEKLEALVPAYLGRIPKDVISGASIRYQLTADGHYRLWEVGWDGRDEGGTLAWPSNGKGRPDYQRGDWVWQYTAMTPNGTDAPEKSR